jgi:ribosomal protein S21
MPINGHFSSQNTKSIKKTNLNFDFFFRISRENDFFREISREKYFREMDVHNIYGAPSTLEQKVSKNSSRRNEENKQSTSLFKQGR